MGVGLTQWKQGNHRYRGRRVPLTYSKHVLPVRRLLKAHIFITEVSCGNDHTGCLDSLGIVRTFGGGSKGQLGLGDYHRRNVPTAVQGLKGYQVTQLVCGAYHSMVAIATIGRCYAWGSNRAGQLGFTRLELEELNRQDGDGNHPHAVPEENDRNLGPPHGHKNGNHRVNQSRGTHTTKTTHNRTARRSNHQHPHNHDKPKTPGEEEEEQTCTCLPREVPGIEAVTQVSCGSHHSAAIT